MNYAIYITKNQKISIVELKGLSAENFTFAQPIEKSFFLLGLFVGDGHVGIKSMGYNFFNSNDSTDHNSITHALQIAILNRSFLDTIIDPDEQYFYNEGTNLHFRVKYENTKELCAINLLRREFYNNWKTFFINQERVYPNKVLLQLPIPKHIL